MVKPKSHAQKLKELNDIPARDLDPEDVGLNDSESDESNLEYDVAPNSAREHYELVEKSKLRKPQAITLGPQYAGSKVRRDAVDEDDEDDPFTRDFSESGDDDENLSGDEYTSEGVSEDQEGGEIVNGFDQSSGEENDSDDESENTDITNNDDEMHWKYNHKQERVSDGLIGRTELRKLMADDQKTVAATLSQSAKADAEKGKAVKSQRATFDALLNSRIKLQKALVATNTLLVVDHTGSRKESDHDIVKAAEESAITLWNNLNSLRSSLQSLRTGQKRSHKEFTSDYALDTAWDEMESYEIAQRKPRNAALDFWASKTRAATALPQARGRLQQPVKEQQLSDVLTGQMVDMTRLVAKTQQPRSCAPVQAVAISKKPAAVNGTTNDMDDNDERVANLPIFDDADFYTTLLASLISQRSTDAAVNLNGLSLQPWHAAREAKTKKAIDTKASKGRKLRYTVHEKLVSFMAPEDRGSWGDRQADELFGSLFGRRIALAEDGSDAMMEDEAEVEGLRLFGGR